MNLLQYLDSRSVQYWTKGKNVAKNHVNITCLFCDDHSNHLGINLKSLLASCYRCGGKSLIKIIMKIERCDYHHAISIHNDIASSANLLPIKEEIPRISESDLLSGFSSSLDRMHLTYLSARGFDPFFLQKKYLLMSAPNFGKYKFRLVVPIIMNFKPVSFIARDITEKQEPKYRMPNDDEAILPRKKIIYNIDTVGNSALVVEGVTDVWRIGDGAIATLSTGFSMAQVAQILIVALANKTKNVFVMYDSGDEAQQRAKEIAERLAVAGAFQKVERLELDEGDPADLLLEEVNEIRREIFGE